MKREDALLLLDDERTRLNVFDELLLCYQEDSTMQLYSKSPLRTLHRREEFEFDPLGKNPEKNLVASIIGFAFLDLRDNRPEKLRRDAHMYLMGEGYHQNYPHYPFSAENCCLILDICIEDVRELADRLFRKPTHFRW